MVPLYDFTGDPRRPQFDDPELDALAPGGRAGSARGVRLGPPASPAQALTSGVQFPPPDLVVYPSGSDLYAEGTSLAIANGTSGTVATFALGQANVGVINSWIIYGNNLTAALVATWQLIINGSTPAGGTRRVPPQTSAFGAIAWGPTEILFRLPVGPHAIAPNALV